jgi:glyoxylase-like metal-dependent hydrolase (beta-lactamase superfamily II)
VIIRDLDKNDAEFLSDGEKNAFALFFGQERVWKPADVLLHADDEIQVGDATFTVVHTPGHSPGSVCYLCQAKGVMFTGDTLFADNIGRCDLWGGSYATIRDSLRALRSYDGTLTIYPGHGDTNRLSKALDNTMYI